MKKLLLLLSILTFSFIQFGPDLSANSLAERSLLPISGHNCTGLYFRLPQIPVVKAEKPSAKTIRVIAVGDILIHTPILTAATTDDNSHDFSPFFEYVTPFLKGDLIIANLENPLAGNETGFSGYPAFNAPTELASNLQKVGFNFLNLANNHCLDRGWKGLKATIATVSQILGYCGAYDSAEDKEKRLITEINGLRIAILGYTYAVNDSNITAPPDEPWRLGFISREAIFNDLAWAGNLKADFIIINLHFGQEYHRQPSDSQKTLVADLLAGDPQTGIPGADLILGHHPHVLQPFTLNEETQKATIYSLGNFLSNQTQPFTQVGMILDIKLVMDPSGIKSIMDSTLIPTYCQKRSDKTYRILPLPQALSDPLSYGLDQVTATSLFPHLNEARNILVSMDHPNPAPVSKPISGFQRASVGSSTSGQKPALSTKF